VVVLFSRNSEQSEIGVVASPSLTLR